MDNHLSIKTWKEEDRPREKLLTQGANALSDAELLAIIIGSGNLNETAVELSRRILHSVGSNLDELGKLTIPSLIKNFKGIGSAKAITITAALELGRRRKISQPETKPKVLESKHVFDIFYQKMADLPYEEFWMLTLNRANKITGQIRLTQGGTAQTVVEIPMILKIAIEKLASNIIVCHNHPSGNIDPSQQDINITKKLAAACKLMDINFLDHLIIGNNTYYSFADEGCLE